MVKISQDQFGKIYLLIYIGKNRTINNLNLLDTKSNSVLW